MEDHKKESLDTTLNECESSNKKIIDFIKDWWLIALIICLALYILNQVKDFYFEKQDLCFISQEVESLGQMGDFFGGMLNPILGFLSFCLLLITIKLQSKELKNSTEELAKSSKALTEQSKSLQLQNFENTFFNLIELYNFIKINLSKIKTIEHLEYKNSKNKVFNFNVNKYKNELEKIDNGIEKIAMTLFYFQKEFNTYPEEYYNNERIPKEIQEKYKTNQFGNPNKIYIALNNKYSKYIGHYINTIYEILYFIHRNEHIKDKQFYSNILRSQLDKSELLIIFYHSISYKGKNILPLLIEYEFFEFFPFNSVICEHTIKQYIEETKKMNKDFLPHKVFGNHIEYKNKISKMINTSSQEPQ